ncbi:hypothetical protein, partial [Shimia sp. SDUM112013]|uniref:hypothetical protein n=1 Tax=Shimia sp. SDUM112013 TaxID=3136160 RepID=UPI0032EF71F6
GQNNPVNSYGAVFVFAEVFDEFDHGFVPPKDHLIFSLTLPGPCEPLSLFGSFPTWYDCNIRFDWGTIWARLVPFCSVSVNLQSITALFGVYSHFSWNRGFPGLASRECCRSRKHLLVSTALAGESDVTGSNIPARDQSAC